MASRALFPGLSVDRLTDQVGVTVVARGLLDHVQEDPAEIERLVAPAALPYRSLVERGDGVNSRAAAFTRLLVQRAQLGRVVFGRGAELPVGIRLSVDIPPPLRRLVAEEGHAEPAVFDERHVLEQPGEVQR